MTTFNQFGYFQHNRYTYIVGQFSEETWTSPVQFFPSNGAGDHEGCYASALKTAERFAQVATATEAVNIDGGVRNCILEGAVNGLLARYNTSREELLAAWWRAQKDSPVTA